MIKRYASLSDSKVIKLKTEILNRLPDNKNELLNKYPLDTYLKFLNAYPVISDYKYVSPHVNDWCNKITSEYGKQSLHLYHQLLLMELIQNNYDEAVNYPEPIGKYYDLNFNRIFNNIDTNANTLQHYDYISDRFNKELSICTLKMIPTGARKIHLDRMPLIRILLNNDWRHLFFNLIPILHKLKGLKPIYHQHLDSNDPDLMAEFSSEGWVRHYKAVGKLLERQSNIKGIMGISWYYDPNMATISPHLAFMTKLVIQNGGGVFRFGQKQQAIKNATLYSKHRKNLFLKGKYEPINFLLIWPRNSLLQWLKNTQTQ